MEDILFNEAEHRYYDANGNNYTSVTTLIGKYEKPYDGEFWAMFTALKNNNFRIRPVPEKRSIYIGNTLTKVDTLYKDPLFNSYADIVKAQWKATNQEACIRGNETHNHLEDSINISKGDRLGSSNRLITPGNKQKTLTLHDLNRTDLSETFPEVHKRLTGYLQRGYSIFAEKKVFLQEFLIAGMIDVPLIHEDGVHFCILDWKTNKDELHDTSGYYKKIKVGGKWVKSDIWVETGDTFLYPLDHLQMSKKNIYSIQLSMYAYILEQWGYKLVPNGLEIIHFPLDSPARLIKIPYLKEEVKMLLNHYKHSMVA